MSLGASTFRKALLLTALIAVTPTAIANQQPASSRKAQSVTPAVVEQPRSFGYVVGDLVRQRVLLTTLDREFEPGELPPVQRVNIWFERRKPRIDIAADGRRWLAVDYQLINAPPALATVQLPGWKIEDKRHRTQLTIPAASISVAPLISATSSTAGELRPDREPSIIDTAASRTNMWLWSLALAATLIAWLAWLQWRNWQDSHNRPFARALRELQGVDESAPEAWQAVHRAFDQTAGRVLQIETLSALFDRAPYLQPQRAQIERFFAQSNERFFGAGKLDQHLSVGALCNELRRIERRHAQ